VSARIRHIASMSSNPMAIGTMYESIFALNFDKSKKPPSYGEVLTDGEVNLNLHHRLPGQRLGLDHFGIEVDDVDATLDKIKQNYPNIGWINRPPNCPYSGYMMHDIAGSIFALSETGTARGTDEFVRERTGNFDRWSDADQAGRIFHHYSIRTRKLDECADFYEDVFGFTRIAKASDDPNHYLYDGNMTLHLLPWSIQDYGGISVTGRGPDHIGFLVEDAVQVEKEIDSFFRHFSPGQAPLWVLTTINDRSTESQVRANMIDKSCPMSTYQFTDKDGTFVAIGDKSFEELKDKKLEKNFMAV
jgi:catechol 2,3-dioxygenase-like lactoylglutathione lyase family enzyme